MERDASDMEARLDERLKRKAFAHHDCQSMSVNLGYAARLRGLLSQRRNTTTGASAASMASSTASSSSSSSLLNASASSASLTASAPAASGKAHSKLKTQLTFPPPSIEQEEKTTPTPNSDETDQGDGKSNQLLHSCPFFRNEVGGEPEWSVGVTRSSSPNPIPVSSCNSDRQHPPPAMLHKPIGTYGVSVVEFPVGKTHWRHGICPYQKQPSVLERGDQGAFYYGNHFYGQEHQNWFGKALLDIY
jgi:signal-induced proliferation-associated 1 like protein 1